MNNVSSIEPLSVCVTTRNVVDTIDTCLDSISELADEIVVLDSDSNDGTLEICRSYDADIYQYEFEGFADMFRTAISKASNDWVLLLDADEEVSSELKTEIERKLANPDSVAFEIPLKTQMFGDWVRTSQTKTCLARKDVIEFRQDYIHPQMSVLSEYEDQISTMTHPINHYTYDRVSEYIEKFDQYTSLEAIRHVDSGSRPSYLRFFTKAVGVCFYHLFVNRAILDGYRGILFGLLSFQYQMVTHAKIKDIDRLQKEEPDEWRDIWITEECGR